MSVYFITCREIDRVKIGYAGHAKRRFHSVQTHCPFRLALEAVLDGDQSLERELHHRFRQHRQRGEWFTITPEMEKIIAANRPPTREPTNNCIERLLTRFRISQHDLADRLGVNQATISRLKTGKMAISRRTELAASVLEQALESEAA